MTSELLTVVEDISSSILEKDVGTAFTKNSDVMRTLLTKLDGTFSMQQIREFANQHSYPELQAVEHEFYEMCYVYRVQTIYKVIKQRPILTELYILLVKILKVCIEVQLSGDFELHHLDELTSAFDFYQRQSLAAAQAIADLMVRSNQISRCIEELGIISKESLRNEPVEATVSKLAIYQVISAIVKIIRDLDSGTTNLPVLLFGSNSPFHIISETNTGFTLIQNGLPNIIYHIIDEIPELNLDFRRPNKEIIIASKSKPLSLDDTENLPATINLKQLAAFVTAYNIDLHERFSFNHSNHEDVTTEELLEPVRIRLDNARVRTYLMARTNIHLPRHTFEIESDPERVLRIIQSWFNGIPFDCAPSNLSISSIDTYIRRVICATSGREYHPDTCLHRDVVRLNHGILPARPRLRISWSDIKRLPSITHVREVKGIELDYNVVIESSVNLTTKFYLVFIISGTRDVAVRLID
jgi:hypothetical protein